MPGKSFDAFAATGLAPPFSLAVPENGLIALNVPLDPLRLGALSTRTTHPFYIARWNELLAEGRHVAATAGSDAHENALPVMRWQSVQWQI